MKPTFQPVRVANGCDEEGLLIFDDEEKLVAVVTHLSDGNEVAPGQWFLEAGFGRLNVAVPPTFIDLDAVQAWISRRLTGER